MFVIVGTWQNLTSEEKKKPIEEKMAMALKHAGVSITVTSVTDIVAFGIGGSTVSNVCFCVETHCQFLQFVPARILVIKINVFDTYIFRSQKIEILLR